MKKTIVIIAISFLVQISVFAFVPGPASVAVRATAPPEPLQPGKPAMLTIELSIPSPYHINSDQPLQDYLIPTSLEFEPSSQATLGKVVFPRAIIKKFGFSDEPLAVFEGVIRVTVDINTPPDLAGEEIVVKGRVRYQACDDQTCFPPTFQPFTLTIPVKGSKNLTSTPTPVGRDQGRESVFTPALDPEQAPLSPWADFSGKGVPAMLFLVFVGGLGLNLTPCIYPMIPITISYFGGQARRKRGSIFLHSLLYVVGMAVTYSTLGVVASMTGSLFGGVLRYPAVLVGLALIMILLGLSMFGFYELRLPAWLVRTASGSQKGFWGTFLMGLTVGIVAAPCIGPFVLGLLAYVGNQGNALLGFALFFVLALGLGLPFLMLGIFSGSIARLPRPGAWMLWVRKVFGFVLLALAVYFLRTLFPSLLAYRLTMAATVFLAGVYLAWIDAVPSAGKVFLLVRNAVGVIFFAFALYTGITGIEAGIKEWQSRLAGPVASGSIQWFPYSEEMLELAAREGKPILIDFYADWCAPCKELDRRTYSAPRVVALSRKFVMLKVDLTQARDLQGEALRRKYLVRGVPTLVFLKPDGTELVELRGTGFEPEESLVKKMQQALQKSAQDTDPL